MHMMHDKHVVHDSTWVSKWQANQDLHQYLFLRAQHYVYI